MNRLKAYVRRTILESARENVAYLRGNRDSKGRRVYTAAEARAEALRCAFADASRGTDTGWWNDLIYNADVERLAKLYRRDIAAAVGAYLDETGCGASDKLGETCGQAFTPADIFRACAGPLGPNATEEARDALSYGLRFAVEWLTNEVASEMGVEL